MSTPDEDAWASGPFPERQADAGRAGEGGIESVLLGPRVWNPSEVAERAQVARGTGRLWRALGFPAVADDERAFTDADVEALRAGERLMRAGIISADSETMMARALAHHLSRLAEWQIHTLATQLSAARGQTLEEVAVALLPELEMLQRHVWRRHLAAYAARELPPPGSGAHRDEEGAPHPPAEQSGGFPVIRQAVGFTDMVGYTRMTRGMDGRQLARMIDRFEELTSGVAADGYGRILKTIGDEILLVADTADGAVSIALDMISRTEADPELPRVRTGLAYGTVLSRFGDVYGSTVNTAARLTALARPGTTLVDPELAAELSDLPGYSLQRLRAVAVRGYRRLRPVLLRTARRQQS